MSKDNNYLQKGWLKEVCDDVKKEVKQWSPQMKKIQADSLKKVTKPKPKKKSKTALMEEKITNLERRVRQLEALNTIF